MRYFFIRYHLGNRETKIEFCPTNETLAEYFAKPKQGKKFLAFRNKILGTKSPASTDRSRTFVDSKHYLSCC